MELCVLGAYVLYRFSSSSSRPVYLCFRCGKDIESGKEWQLTLDCPDPVCETCYHIIYEEKMTKVERTLEKMKHRKDKI
jgi:DNA-directed RNA polymerase subunit RPC12/RpoP